jgi:hypothetical protein
MTLTIALAAGDGGAHCGRSVSLPYEDTRSKYRHKILDLYYYIS